MSLFVTDGLKFNNITDKNRKIMDFNSNINRGICELW